jgi:hypothetical protein
MTGVTNSRVTGLEWSMRSGASDSGGPKLLRLSVLASEQLVA